MASITIPTRQQKTFSREIQLAEDFWDLYMLLSSIDWVTLTQYQMSKPSIKFPLFFPKWAFKILVHPLLA